MRLLAIILAGLVFCMPALAWGGSSIFTPQIMNIGFDKGTAEDWLNEGNEFYNQGELEEAIRAWDEAIGIDPKFAIAWYNKGIALDDLGKYEEAIDVFDQAIKINPQHANAWNAKAVILKAIGRTSESEEAFARARDLGYTG